MPWGNRKRGGDPRSPDEGFDPACLRHELRARAAAVVRPDAVPVSENEGVEIVVSENTVLEDPILEIL